MNPEELMQLATELGTASDKIGKEIHKFEEEMAKFNFGVMAWHQDRQNQGTRVGYIKIDGKWKLAVEYHEHETLIVKAADHAPRALRLYAYRRRKEVADAVVLMAQKLLSKINAALDGIDDKEEEI